MVICYIANWKPWQKLHPVFPTCGGQLQHIVLFGAKGPGSRNDRSLRHWVETFTDFWASSVLENHTITIGKVLVYEWFVCQISMYHNKYVSLITIHNH